MLTKKVNGIDVVMSAEEEAAVRAEWAANDAKKAEYEAKQAYKDKRKAEYPDAQDLFNALWDAMDSGQLPQIKGFYDAIKSVNNKYPGPGGK